MHLGVFAVWDRWKVVRIVGGEGGVRGRVRRGEGVSGGGWVSGEGGGEGGCEKGEGRTGKVSHVGK